jgi:hypothetical protein
MAGEETRFDLLAVLPGNTAVVDTDTVASEVFRER